MDHMERRQNEELMEARRLRRQEQKRKLLMRQRVLAAVLLVIFVLSLILILRGCRNRREHPELYAKKNTTLQLETEPDTTVTISAVGDIMITDELLADAKQPDGSYNFAESFAAVSGYTLSSGALREKEHHAAARDGAGYHRDHLRRRRYHDHGRAARRREAAGRQL